MNNCELTVIATNIPVRHDRPLLETAKALISALGEEVSRHAKITDVKRCPDRATGKPPLLKIAFENVEQKVQVLRAKESLKRTHDFKNVYLRSSKNHTERILELNAKTLLSQLPNGNQYRVTANGRIVKKDNRNENPNVAEANPTTKPVNPTPGRKNIPYQSLILMCPDGQNRTINYDPNLLNILIQI